MTNLSNPARMARSIPNSESYSRRSKNQSGFLLIESMVALALFSIAMMGLAGLQLANAKNNFSSLQKTETAVTISEIVDRMRTNLGDVSAGNYDRNIGDALPTEPYNNQAEDDLVQWLNNLRNSLKNITADGSISCGGLLGQACSISIEWYDSHAEGSILLLDYSADVIL